MITLLATGLVPDHHGIINNNFYAEELGGIYRIGDQDMVTNGKAYLGEPIWVTAEKQGVRAGCYYWVGSEAEIQGVRPTFWNTYDERALWRTGDPGAGLAPASGGGTARVGHALFRRARWNGP
ncbi:MAG: alkaline phosphatase family protein [Bacteroidales bacterium]